MGDIFFTIITTRPFEDLFGWLTYKQRAYDDGLASRNTAIASAPQTLTVTSDVGPTNSLLPKDYGSSLIGGKDRIPSLSWSAPADIQGQVKEWVVLKEDPDAPVGEPIVHGIYYGIPTSKTSVTQDDFKPVGPEADRKLTGGFFYGQNIRGTIFIPPRPIIRHGPHRYFFTVLALSQNVNWDEVKRAAAEEAKKNGKKVDPNTNFIGKNETLKAVDGRVLSWGEWVAVYDRMKV